MTLLLILFLLVLVLFALFLGGGLVAQGYLYQQPADRLPLRALAGSLLVGAFVTTWVWIDRGAPKKYDTFFEFAPYVTKEFDEFEAIRWVSSDGTRVKADESGQKLEVVVKYKKGSGTKIGKFVEEGTNEEFQMNASGKSGDSYMTIAIRAKPEPNAEPVRFNAKLREVREQSIPTYVTGPDGRRFHEDKGSRYIQGESPGTIFVPSTWGVILALFINFLHFAIWFIAFWPILQFTRGHAFILAASFTIITMLLLMPLLFGHARPKPTAAEPVRTVWRQERESWSGGRVLTAGWGMR